MGLDPLLQRTLGVSPEILHLALLALNIFHFFLGLGSCFAAGFSRQDGVVGLLRKLLIFVNHRLTLFIKLFDLFGRFLLSIAKLEVGLFRFVMAVVDFSHVDNDELKRWLREQSDRTSAESGQGEEGTDHLIHSGRIYAGLETGTKGEVKLRPLFVKFIAG